TYRQDGRQHLRFLSMEEIESLLKEFVVLNYGILASETFLCRFECSYAEFLQNSTKAEFAEALEQSSLFNPPTSTVLFPLDAVQVQTTFDGATFFLCTAADLTTDLVGFSLPGLVLTGRYFPPLEDFDGRPQHVASWLGVK